MNCFCFEKWRLLVAGYSARARHHKVVAPQAEEVKSSGLYMVARPGGQLMSADN